VLQRHSRYSTQQFIALSAQLDAMREELHKERSLRQNAAHEHSQETTLLHEKIEMLETLSTGLHDRLARVAINVQLDGKLDGKLPGK
jgi:uncharacterized membrane protein YgaE (UPF0421/DUF939 family)